MKFDCVVLEIFHISVGDVAILGFLKNKGPRIKMILQNEFDSQWEITRIGSNRKLDSSTVYAKFENDSIWDCVLKSINHFYKFKLGLLVLPDLF